MYDSGTYIDRILEISSYLIHHDLGILFLAYCM